MQVLKSAPFRLALLALCIAGDAGAAVLDETGPVSQGTPSAVAPAGPQGVGENRLMRTKSSLNAIQAAFDQSDPKANIERVRYDPQMTYKLRLREYMRTTIVLPKSEAIDAYVFGDDEVFQFSALSSTKGGNKNDTDRLDNIFAVWPKNSGADTSLSVIGRSGRIYSFYLRSDSVKSPHMPQLVFYIEDPADGFQLPRPATQTSATTDKAPQDVVTVVAGQDKEKLTGEDAAATAEYLRSLPVVDPKSINLNAYKVVDGDKALSPIRVFDDGYWTYFQFSKDGNLDKSKVPAIYRVVDGYDTPANVRVEGGTVIAETMSKGWTLRAGEAHLCIRAK